MSESKTLPRPRQVTLAAWMIISGSVILVIALFEQVSSLHQLETRDAVTRMLSEPPFDGLGLGLESALTILRTLSMVAAGSAAAAAILGYHVLKRNRAARLALTLVAVPLFFTGFVVGGFLSSLVAASAVLLWMAPARDWFNGIAATPRADLERRQSPTPPPTAPPPVQGPRPHQGFGSIPSGSGSPSASPYAPPPPGSSPYDAPPPADAQHPGIQPYAPPAWAGPHPATTGRRPNAVLVACIVTWVFSTLAVLLMGATALVIGSDPKLLLDEMYRQNPQLAEQGLDRDSLVTLTRITSGVVVVWAVAAIVLAVLVFRRVRWARVALLVSAGAAGGMCLVGSLQSPLLAVPLLACVLAFSLLLRPDVRAWFARS